VSDPLADWPDRTPLCDESGTLVLVFSASESVRDAIPWADGVWVEPAVDRAYAVEVALQAMPGWLFSTSDPLLAQATLAAGATERRHALTLSRSVTGPPLPALGGGSGEVRVEPLTPAQVDRHALTLGAINHRAYPADHPDAFDGDQAAAVSQLRAIARGELLGLMLPESRVALVDGRIVGACLVVDRPGDPPHSGPWVIDIFRDPQCPVRGVGTALLHATLNAAAEAGLPALSLAVSHGNTAARRLYERLGFTEVGESWTLVLPKEDERPISPS
jgi:ribosomal protein S18 acetylase RimI-like enzyme